MYKAIKRSEIPPRGNLGAVKDIQDFMETSYEAAEIKIPEGRKAADIMSAYRQQAKKMGLLGSRLKVCSRNGKAYMEKVVQK